MRLLDEKRLEENIRSIAEYDLSENNLFGSAYMVCQDGKPIFRGFFGTADEKGTPLSEKHIFRLASMTKPITAMAALILIDKGLISLDTQLKKYFPAAEKIHVVPADGTDMGETPIDVTLLHLLTHTSGLGSTKSVQTSEKDRESIENLLLRYCREGLDFVPGTMQAYSGVVAFDGVAALVQAVSGESFADFLQREIFVPCGMKDTTFMPNDEQKSRMVAMHAKVNGKNETKNTCDDCVFENFPSSHMLAGAGLASTLDDYSKFAEMLLSRGKAGEKSLVGEESFRLYDTPHIPEKIMQRDFSWGLGVRVVTDPSNVLPVSSFGWSGAYGSHFWVDPVNRITAVFMKNSCYDGGAGNASAQRFEKAVMQSLSDKTE